MRLDRDLESHRAIMVKGWLFLGIAVLASVNILFLAPRWEVGLLLAIALWAAARWYYFMFYVIEKYADPEFRFAGLGSFLRYMRQTRGNRRES